jgi:peptidylprolyl isomerase
VRLRHPIALSLAVLSLAAAGCGEEEASEVADEARQEQGPQSQEEVGGSAQEARGEAATAEQAAQRTKPEIEVPEGPPPEQLRIEDVIEGSGPEVSAGQQIAVNYIGVAYSSGEEFDNSFDRGMPFEFALGGGMVIPGWDQGIEGMKVGGRRRLTIPSELAYGPQGQPPAIGPDETLIFEIDLLAAQ